MQRAVVGFFFALITVSLPLIASAGTATTTFSTPGTTSFTVPSGFRSITVIVKGAGGGGGGRGDCTVSATAGSAGGTSSFNSSLQATGGGGGQPGTPDDGSAGAGGSTGSGSGGDTNLSGGGGGGGGTSTGHCDAGGGGGTGGFAAKRYAFGSLPTNTNITVVVGQGGAGGTGANGSLAGTGTDGSVEVGVETGLVLTKGSSVTGGLSITGNLSKGSGTFVIDHPLDPKNMLLFHSFVESPDVKNIYDGVATLDNKGSATIELPAYFLALNKEFRYLASPSGNPMPNLHVSEEIHRRWGFFGPIEFSISGGTPRGTISWQVTGIRHDPYILAHPIIVEVSKSATTLVAPGSCIFAPLCQ